MLSLSEDSEGFAKLINGFDNLGAGLGEFIPIDVGILSDSFDDRIEVFLYSSNINLAHVER